MPSGAPMQDVPRHFWVGAFFKELKTMASFRQDRINEEMRRELDKIIRSDVRDPRTQCTYSITRADVTRDMRYAKVHVSVLEADKREGMLRALKGAAGFLRHELGRMQLRYTPELLFELDTNIEYADHIGKLLRDVGAANPAAGAAGVDDDQADDEERLDQ